MQLHSWASFEFNCPILKFSVLYKYALQEFVAFFLVRNKTQYHYYYSKELFLYTRT